MAGPARSELRLGDEQYRSGDWADAIRYYHSALESGLKHRLDEAGATYGTRTPLAKLAAAARAADVVPPNYQQLFSFPSSIRSPLSHGAGGTPQAVAAGKAEALLLGNLVRSLLVYLGQRPR